MIRRDVSRLTYSSTYVHKVNGYAGTSAYRTYVPAFLPENMYEQYPIPLMNMDTRSIVAMRYQAIENLHTVYQNWKFRISAANEQVVVCKIPGMLYELNSKVFIHILIARNVENAEDFRIYMSYDFITKPVFKTAYRRFMNGGFVRSTDTFVITNDIASLFFDETVLPKFNSLDDMAEYKKYILKIVSGNKYNAELEKLIT